MARLRNAALKRRVSRVIRKGRGRLPLIPTYKLKCEKYFAMFGCWGMGCSSGSAQRRVANDIAKNSGIEFIVVAGDNMYKYDLEVDEFFQSNVDICYTKPIYAALGNHDLEHIEDQIRYTNDLWHLPARNYMIDINDDIRIFVVDTNPIIETRSSYRRYISNRRKADREYERSLKEFRNFVRDMAVESSRERKFTICVGHHPLITNRHNVKGRLQKRSLMDLEKDMQTIVKCCDMYVCADEHNLQHLIFKDEPLTLNQFIIGGGGGEPDEKVVIDYPHETKFVHPYHGYGIFDVNTKKMILRCLNKRSGRFNDKYTFGN
jgi:hypothetical protein